MRSKSLRIQFLAAMAIILSLFANSCSESPKDLVKLIPAETKGVLILKPETLAQKVDIKKLEKGLDFSEKEKESFADMMQLATEGGIDLEQIIFFEYQENFFASFLIKDEEAFSKTNLIRDNFTKSEMSGFTCYEMDDNKEINILIDGKKAWMAAGDKCDIDVAADNVKTFLSLKEEASIAASKAFNENMGQGDISFYMNMEEIMDFAEKEGLPQNAINRELMKMGISADDINLDEVMTSRIFYTMEIGKDNLSLKGKATDKDGKNIMDKLDLRNIDADILRYLDKNSTLAYAVALPEQAVKMYKKMIVKEAPQMEELAAKIFDNLDGTLALGLTLSEDFISFKERTRWNYATDNYETYMRKEFNPNALHGSFVIKFKKDMTQELSAMAAQAGIPVTDGKFEMPVTEDMKIRIFTDGKYLVVSNFDTNPQPLKDNGLFAKNVGACFLDLTKDTPAARGIKKEFGIDLDMTATAYGNTSEGVFEVKIHNNKEKSALEYFIRLTQEIIAAANA